MKPSSYDAAYFMEESVSSEDRAIPLAQAAKIVKPGGIVAGYQQWFAEAGVRLRQSAPHGPEAGHGVRRRVAGI